MGWGRCVWGWSPSSSTWRVRVRSKNRCSSLNPFADQGTQLRKISSPPSRDISRLCASGSGGRLLPRGLCGTFLKKFGVLSWGTGRQRDHSGHQSRMLTRLIFPRWSFLCGHGRLRLHVTLPCVQDSI